MAAEGLRGYVQLASGLTEASVQRAREVAQALLSGQGREQAGKAGKVVSPIAHQVQEVAEDLVATSRTNRDLLVGLIRGEVERGVAALGIPTQEEVDRLRRRIDRLEKRVAEAAGGAGAASGTSRPVTRSTTTAPATPPKKKAPAKRVPVKKAPSGPVDGAKQTTAKSVSGEPATTSVATPGSPADVVDATLTTGGTA